MPKVSIEVESTQTEDFKSQQTNQKVI